MPRQKGQAAIEKKNEVLTELAIEYLFLDEITPNDYNPNRQNDHEFDLLCRSMSEDGFTQPIIVGLDGRIVDGEHRWRAAKAIGLEKIPVVKVPMEAAQARIATLRHNRARGSEDVELSVAVLRDLEQLGALDWAQDSLQLDDAELQRLLDDIPAPEALAADEFSEAWIPGTGATSGGQDKTYGEDGRVDLTVAAADRQREREKALKAAKTEEERAAIRKDRSIYRLSLSFTDDEGALVKSVLGHQPAARILELCQAAAAAGDLAEPKAEKPAA